MSAPSKSMWAQCDSCGLPDERSVDDFTAIDAGESIHLVWRCEGCGVGEMSSGSAAVRALVLASGCTVLHVDQDGPGVLQYLVDGPAYPRRPRRSPLAWLAQWVRRSSKRTEREGGARNG